MKKKILTIALVVALVATCFAGTFAYLTDNDAQTNVFTVGNVQIDLTENFSEENAHLVPATGSAQDGTLQNGITKEVFVTNTGKDDAYVRVHIAIPTLLDDAQPNFDASKNVLHFNYAPENVGATKWDWSNTTGTPYEGNWNFYTTEIAGISYNVYVVTYEAAIYSGFKTESAIHQVYLDPSVTN